jgi:hypothetical protein
MSRWPRGEAEVEQLVARRELELVAGAGADGTPLLAQAQKTAATAAAVVLNDAYSAYVLAYDAARFACIALMAQQGLRATTSGGHYAVERTVRAQFGEGFRPFATSWNILTYPETRPRQTKQNKLLRSHSASLLRPTSCSASSFFTQPQRP